MAKDDTDRGPDKGKPVSMSELRRLLLRVIDYQGKLDQKLARIEARNAIIEAMLKGIISVQDEGFRNEMKALDRLSGLIPGERALTPEDVTEMLDKALKGPPPRR